MAILSRIGAAGATCWVALDDNRVCAYLFAYRSMLGSVTPLGAPFDVKPDGDTLYLHDLAVARAWAGRGAGRFLTQVALDHAHAHGLRFSALVAVQDAHRYWHKLGYAGHDALDEHALAALSSYPGSPGYMMRPLKSRPRAAGGTC